jgi:hypothetical protein
VWDAIADFGQVHRRVAPGFLTDAKLEGETRVVTFASGAVFREHLVDADPAARRLVYAIAEPPFLSYQGTVEVFPTADGRSRLTWTVDLLPNELADRISAAMDEGVRAMKPALEAAVPA